MSFTIERISVAPASMGNLAKIGREDCRSQVERATVAGLVVEFLVARRRDDEPVASALLEHPECVPGSQAAADRVRIVDFRPAPDGDPVISAALLREAAAPVGSNPDITLIVETEVLGDAVIPVAEEVGFEPHGHNGTFYLTAAGLSRALHRAA